MRTISSWRIKMTELRIAGALAVLFAAVKAEVQP
jgi:hypothetical protein